MLVHEHSAVLHVHAIAIAALAHDIVVVIEQNRDEQLRRLLLLETDCAKEKLVSVTDYGGQPLSKGHVLEGVAPYLEVATVEAS